MPSPLVPAGVSADDKLYWLVNCGSVAGSPERTVAADSIHGVNAHITRERAPPPVRRLL
jgi:hypothetical protein